MTLGLRAILLAAAVVCFIIAIFATTHYPDWLAIGLACTAGAWLADSLGWADRTVGSMAGGRRSTT
jgi:hypothetical protein